MKDVRIKETENEKLVRTALGEAADYKNFNMSEQSIDTLIAKEKERKFNSELELYQEKIDSNKAEQEANLEDTGFDIEKLEIKPMFSRVIVKPYKVNPFQQIKRDGAIITDVGGYDPHMEYNPKTGKYEEQKPDVVTGVIIEVGPETKYLQEGDVVFYRLPTTIPVPFFKQGLVSLAENLIIAVVNESLQERFNNLK